ncbi:VOC family protein [Actinomadura viridis]|uniref:Enzyme related to lactoylglutathione lyase n=1 Tax=Actinomadura viridis TaxID=58110 RepID=A0A931GJP6_9ACTN|nr:VOC family protein [Actinomadura viridis]MBG6089417.1 putative enzyme related to lactoylglutathione lyase [Actinomadura viridis]
MPDRRSYEPGTPCWIDLGTPDIASAKAFYGGLFGWYALPSPPVAGGYTMMTLGPDDGRPVAALMPQTVEGEPVAWTTYVSVADLDAAVGAVRADGGQVLLEPMDILDQGRMAIFADSVGAVLGAWQPLAFPGAGVVNEPGAFCWSELACRDVGAARAFYGEVFGWRGEPHPVGGSAETHTETHTETYTEWSVPGGAPFGGMIRMDERWPAEVPPHWSVYFAVAGCDEAAARAAELGGAVRMPPTDIPAGRFAMLRDPQGGDFSVIRLSG